MKLQLRDKMEFSKQENIEFNFFEKNFPEAEIWIGNNTPIIDLFVPPDKVDLYLLKAQMLQDYTVTKYGHKDKIFTITLDRGYSLKTANKFTRFLIDLWDITFNRRLCSCCSSEIKHAHKSRLGSFPKLWFYDVLSLISRYRKNQ